MIEIGTSPFVLDTDLNGKASHDLCGSSDLDREFDTACMIDHHTRESSCDASASTRESTAKKSR
jgi:hypothetical protein